MPTVWQRLSQAPAPTRPPGKESSLNLPPPTTTAVPGAPSTPAVCTSVPGRPVVISGGAAEPLADHQRNSAEAQTRPGGPQGPWPEGLHEQSHPAGVPKIMSIPDAPGPGVGVGWGETVGKGGTDSPVLSARG